MKKQYYYSGIEILLMLLLVGTGCKKQNDFLNQKSNIYLSTITTASDLQNILNTEDIFNKYSDPDLGDISSDEYYETSDNIINQSTTEQNLYSWAGGQVYSVGDVITDWDQPYQEIYYSNIVLDALPKVSGDSVQLNQIRGTALFYRAIAFYNLLQNFSLPYDSTTAGTDLGIPLRLSSDLNQKSVRSTEQNCYNQVIQDLQLALALLPQKSAINTKPSKLTANALLARIYLALGKYHQAYLYADASLAQFNTLTNYNTVIYDDYDFTSSSLNYLDEDLYHSTLNSYAVNDFTQSIADSTLYDSYDSTDLRKTIFFNTDYDGEPHFKGSYEFHQFDLLYSGLAVDELYLIRAECSARAGNLSAALNDVDTLLVNRYVTGTFVPLTAPSADSALKIVLKERRKELCFRGLRWTDLRRLNKDPEFAITLERVVGNTVYTLPPNDKRYALPIPAYEIQLSGIQQNDR